ncbi:MAG: hypothetical protein LBC98_00305 [Prevotellaceae bacterium]|jgi:hypothetical protein|nr:hypothetical protein [Prevotellaceae bacterium]
MKKLFVVLQFFIPLISEGQVIDGLWTLEKVEIRDSSMITGEEIRREAKEEEIAGNDGIVRVMSINGNNCMINGQNFRYSIEGNKFNTFALRTAMPAQAPQTPAPQFPEGVKPAPQPAQPAQPKPIEQNSISMRSYDYLYQDGQIKLSISSFTNRGGPVKSFIEMKLKKAKK